MNLGTTLHILRTKLKVASDLSEVLWDVYFGSLFPPQNTIIKRLRFYNYVFFFFFFRIVRCIVNLEFWGKKSHNCKISDILDFSFLELRVYTSQLHVNNRKMLTRNLQLQCINCVHVNSKFGEKKSEFPDKLLTFFFNFKLYSISYNCKLLIARYKLRILRKKQSELKDVALHFRFFFLRNMSFYLAIARY